MAKPRPATHLILYIPVLHSGYLALFDRYKGAHLHILDQVVLDSYPILKREIRALRPKQVLSLLKDSPWFSRVSLTGPNDLRRLASSGDKIILSDESISDDLVEQYFKRTTAKLVRESVFLRYDEKAVRQTRQEIPFTGTISKDMVARNLFQLLNDQRHYTGDWFLQVAGALVTGELPNIELKATSHNHRQPTEQSMWINGDPRMYLEYGTDTNLRTSLHAEQALIAQAALEGVSTMGASIFVTTFPCPDCAQLIIASGIKRCYFQHGYSQLSADELLTNAGVELIKVV